MPKAGCFCCWTVALTLGALCCAQAVAHIAAHPSSGYFSCSSLQCGMPSHGVYPYLVVGHVAAIANADQAVALFDGMRRRGHWAGLPAQSELFWKNLQPVAIDTGHSVVIVTLTSQSEMHAAPLHVGDYVRYSPHRGKYEVPPADKIAAMYWRVDGCVAVLCRASDKPCMKHYVSGLFRTSDGQQLSPRTLMPLARGTVIDVQTMLPRKVAQVK